MVSPSFFIAGLSILFPTWQDMPQHQPGPTRLEDVVVTGSSRVTTAFAERFVEAVGAPPNARKLARWRN